MCQNYCKIVRGEINKATRSAGQKDIRKSLMLENPSIDSLENFERYFLNQMYQFVELEANSFYKGQLCPGADRLARDPIQDAG